MKSKGSAESFLASRFQEVVLLEQGYKQIEVATVLGVSAGAVSQWKTAHAQGGREALAAKIHPGPEPKLQSVASVSATRGIGTWLEHPFVDVASNRRIDRVQVRGDL